MNTEKKDLNNETPGAQLDEKDLDSVAGGRGGPKTKKNQYKYPVESRKWGDQSGSIVLTRGVCPKCGDPLTNCVKNGALTYEGDCDYHQIRWVVTR